MTLMETKRAVALACACLIVAPEVRAQDAPGQPYKLVVVRGENAQNNIKKGRATRPVVEVRDRNDKPVAGALVLFKLPTSGPSGTFAGGGQVASVTTNNAGQASASFTPNNVAGNVKLDVSSTNNGNTVTAQIVTVNVAVGAAISGTTLAVILGLVGAGIAGAAVAVTQGGGGGNGGGGAAAPGIRIGPGTGSVTPPR